MRFERGEEARRDGDIDPGEEARCEAEGGGEAERAEGARRWGRRGPT